jgi:uncharacterized cupin superfamily protein
MAGGKIIRFEPRGPAETGLVRWPDIPPEALTAGTPVQRGHTYFEDKAIGLSAGVWDCTAMTTRLEPYSVNEFMIVLEGAARASSFRRGCPASGGRTAISGSSS